MSETPEEREVRAACTLVLRYDSEAAMEPGEAIRSVNNCLAEWDGMSLETLDLAARDREVAAKALDKGADGLAGHAAKLSRFNPQRAAYSVAADYIRWLAAVIREGKA